MSIPGAASPLFLATTAGAAAGFEISRSLRFNSGDSSKISRTPSSASNRKTWTMSYWVKRAKLSTEQMVFSAASSSSDRVHFYYESTDNIAVYSPSFYYTTNVIARDPGAWQHLVFACDTTQSTDTDRFKIYVNSVLVTSFVNQSHPSQNLDTPVSNNILHQFSGRGYNSGNHADVYLAEINFIDGQALAPTDFGETDANGVWQAKDTAGLTFGTNGFRLQFADNSGATATTLGKDSSGNSNNFTPNNLSIGLFRQYISEGSTSGSFYTSVGGGADKMFDGSASTGAFSQTGTATFTFGGGAIVASTSIKIRAFKGDSAGANVLVNGTNVSAGLNAQSSGGYSTVDITSLLGSVPITLANVSMVNAGGGSGNIAQIFVDGLELITGSPGGNDSLVDSPTNGTASSGGDPGGAIVGNYATLNPLDRQSTNGTLSNGNLDLTQSSAAWAMYRGTMAVSSGKWYYEVNIGASQYSAFGILSIEYEMASATNNWPSQTGAGKTYALYPYDGKKYDGTQGISYATANTSPAGDVYGVAFDLDNGTITFYKNGSSLGQAFTGISGTFAPAAWLYNQTASDSYNFGSRPFAFAAPTNYKSLNTANLPTPTIADGSQYFDTKLWTGNGTSQTITTDFLPGLIWVKERSNTSSHQISNIISGVGKRLSSNLTDAEYSNSEMVTAFNSDGFSIGNQGGHNENNQTYAGWVWDGGTSTVTNNDGSIASQVRANPSAGFSIVKWTGVTWNGSNPQTIGHGLNAEPEMIILKNIDRAVNWAVYHKSIGNTTMLQLNTTGGKEGNDLGYWNNTTPTNSVFTVGNGYGYRTGGINEDFAALCFAPVAGYSAMGSYTGNNSADGPFVYTGFKPRWIMIKATSFSEHWYIYDTKRKTYNVNQYPLLADSNNGGLSYEGIADGGQAIDILSNGFKIRGAWLTNNGSQNYIWAAFAEHPFASNGGLAR